MAHRVADRIREQTGSNSSPYTLTGAVPGFRSMATALTADGDTGFFVVTNGIDYESFVGTRTSATVLTRTTMLSSTNGGSPVAWPAGTKDVLMDIPAQYTVTSAPANLQASGAGSVKAVGEITYFPKDPGSSQMARGAVATGTEPYVECDGSVYNMSTFPNLGAFLGSTFGGNGTTTFGVPDLKGTGKFVRSRTASVSEGTSQTNQNKTHSHTGSTTVSGTVSGSGTTATESGTHQHAFSAFATTSGESTPHYHLIAGGSGAVQYNISLAVAPGGVGAPAAIQLSNTDFNNVDHTHDVSVSGTTGSENAAHNHSFSFSTSASLGGSLTINADGGTEARPEAFVACVCLKT